MFRRISKFVHSTGLQEPISDAATPARLRPESGPDQSKHASFEPRRVQQIDVKVSYELLRQAIDRFSDPHPQAGFTLVDTRLIEELRKRMLAYESETLRLRSDLEYAQHCANSYWQRCKTIQAELDTLRRGASNSPCFESNSKRGVL